MSLSLSERIERTCRAFGNRPAFLECGPAPISFANLYSVILSFADRLEEAGVKPGDHVVVATREVVSVVALKLALMRIGATPIAVSPAAAASDSAIRVDRAIVPSNHGTGEAFEIPFDPSWIRPATRYVPITAGGRIIHATSGTTGLPKLRNDSDETFVARINNGLRARGPLDGPVLVAHNVGSLVGIKSILSGLLEAQPVMPMLRTPAETVHRLLANQVMHAFIPPLHLKHLLAAAEELAEPITCLRRVNVGGGAISAEFAERCERIFGCPIFTDYGSTETDTAATYRASLAKDTPGLVGPIWNVFEHRFQTLDGQLSTPEEGGELFLRVPQNMRTENYPDPTPLFEDDGWISTGDVGRLSPEGYLILSGRKSDLINLGGNKFAPSMVEAAVRQHTHVAEVAAFRVPTDTGIDAIGLGIVARDGFHMSEFRDFLEKTIGELYEYRVALLEEIPITEAGKTDRSALSGLLLAFEADT